MFQFGTANQRIPALSAPLQGALYMTAAAFFFSIMNYLVRLAAEELEPIEVAFFRNLFGLAFMLPWILRGRGTGLKTDRLGLHFIRALIGLGGMLAWFWGLTHMALAEAVALAAHPLVAIGGIGRDNVGCVASAGAVAAAMISALANSRDPAAETRQLAALFGAGA